MIILIPKRNKAISVARYKTGTSRKVIATIFNWVLPRFSDLVDKKNKPT